MINVFDLPAVKALMQLQAQAQQPGAAPAPVEYARAPEASGPQSTGGRPPATQRSTR